MATSNEDGVPLAATIRHLRHELQDAMAEGANEKLQFRVEGLELTLTVTVTRDTEGGGGIKFWVINASGKIKASELNTHTIKLKLSPVDGKGNEVRISDSSDKQPTLGPPGPPVPP